MTFFFSKRILVVGITVFKSDLEMRPRNLKSQIEFPADSTVMENSTIFLTTSPAGFKASQWVQLGQELLCLPDCFWSFWFFPLSFLLSLSERAFFTGTCQPMDRGLLLSHSLLKWASSPCLTENQRRDSRVFSL